MFYKIDFWIFVSSVRIHAKYNVYMLFQVKWNALEHVIFRF